jgi:hypothetical protein
LSSETKTGLVITGVFAVLVAFIGASAFDRFFYPVVEIAVNETQSNETPSMRMTVTNYGSEPAENLTLIISYPHSAFTSITNEFSTSDITLTNLKNHSPDVLELMKTRNLTSALDDPNLLKLFIKKFYHGIGSKAVLNLRVEKPINLTNFEASAVYDQGSSSWVAAGSFTYKGFIDNITKPGYIIAILVIVIFAISVLMWLLNEKGKGKRISEKAWVTLAGIAIVVIYGVLYALDIFSLTNSRQVAVVPLVIFIASIVPRWQLHRIFIKPSNTRMRLGKISRREIIAVSGFSVLFVIEILYALGILNLTTSQQIMAILLIVGLLAWLVIRSRQLKNQVEIKPVHAGGGVVVKVKRQISPSKPEIAAVCLFMAIMILAILGVVGGAWFWIQNQIAPPKGLPDS